MFGRLIRKRQLLQLQLGCYQARAALQLLHQQWWAALPVALVMLLSQGWGLCHLQPLLPRHRLVRVRSSGWWGCEAEVPPQELWRRCQKQHRRQSLGNLVPPVGSPLRPEHWVRALPVAVLLLHPARSGPDAAAVPAAAALAAAPGMGLQRRPQPQAPLHAQQPECEQELPSPPSPSQTLLAGLLGALDGSMHLLLLAPPNLLLRPLQAWTQDGALPPGAAAPPASCLPGCCSYCWHCHSAASASPQRAPLRHLPLLPLPLLHSLPLLHLHLHSLGSHLHPRLVPLALNHHRSQRQGHGPGQGYPEAPPLQPAQHPPGPSAPPPLPSEQLLRPRPTHPQHLLLLPQPLRPSCCPSRHCPCHPAALTLPGLGPGP